ncbi:hypothetical protein Tco_1050138 [Tanacetum coccineum]
METKEEAYVFEGEGEDIMESEEEDEAKEEEAEQLEEMRAPVVTSWMGQDGITVDGIMCIDDGIIRLNNRCQLAVRNPKLLNLREYVIDQNWLFGHMYGFSCIKKWLLLSSSSGKCPQCKASCLFQDAHFLYPPRLCDTAHQKADDIRHMNILLTRADELEELADALRRRARPLEPRIDALGWRIDALKRLASALRRRIDALGQRDDAFESRVIFYLEMYKEHHKKKWLAERATTKAKKKGEIDAKKAAEKKHKDKEKKYEKKMQASGIVDSISKVILKRKSNNYMYYYAAGAAVVLTVPLAGGYTLYA